MEDEKRFNINYILPETSYIILYSFKIIKTVRRLYSYIGVDITLAG